MISWDASWIGGDAGATIVISDNGVEVKRATGVGELVLTDTGRHELTYTTYVGDVAQKEIYTATIFKDWKFEVSGGGAVITATTQTSGAVTIPPEINGYCITGIGSAAFAACSNLTEVVIPGSVWDIGKGAFANCAGLRRVEVPRGLKSVIESRNVFAGCPDNLDIVYVGAEIKNVTAKQRWPWNGKVDITYTLTGDVTAGLPAWDVPRLFVTASNRVDGTTYAAAASALSGDTGMAEGAHHIVWDLNAQGLEIKSDEVAFSVAYQLYERYCIIDLSGGVSASSYPVTYVASVSSGGFNTDEYKTTKLVLRLVEPGTFMMCGSYHVTLTKPFYCGVFEVTQKQWELVTGSNPCSSTSYGKGDSYPVHYVSYDMIRGSSAGAGWPGSSAVDNSSFLGKLRAKTGVDFDLPTEAQLEYACRAGTTTTYSYGDSADGNYMWYSSNSSSKSHVAGTKQPNAWGLYDMHGNVGEWCLDWYGSLSSGVTDPVGSSSGSYRVRRGGSWGHDADYCTSSRRFCSNPSDAYYYFGFRLVRTLSNTESERSPEAAAGAERADALCAAEAAPVAIDSRVDVDPVLDSVVVAWDAAWIGGDANATVVIADNGTEVKRATDAGEFALPGIGRHELTYTTYIDNVAQDEVYTATVYKDWKYEVVGGGAVITATTQTSGAVTIPPEINGYCVTGIGSAAFAACSNLTEVVIPGSVWDIGERAFADCAGLRRVEVPRGLKSVIESRNVFAGCPDNLDIVYVGAEIKNVTAKQRWPWNGKVDVRFMLTGSVGAAATPEHSPVLTITAKDVATGKVYAAAPDALSGDTDAAGGAHHVVWDLNAQGIEFASDDVVFTVAYTVPQYCVIDLSRGANAATYPVSFMAAPPIGGFNKDAYKTSKLVLRLVEPGSFMMGGEYEVSLTKPYYAGLFEVTQKQYSLVTGSNPSEYKGDTRPVEQVSWNAIRGDSSACDWPNTLNVDADSFVGRLQKRTGLMLDLPTEAQWEYACRAGTTSKYNNGGDSETDLKLLGRYSGNTTDGKGGYSQHTKVGSYQPNAWGLYDMHGNVLEWCLDWHGSLSEGVDPVGAVSGSDRVRNGGSWFKSANYCASSCRGYNYPSEGYNDYGFRIVGNLSDLSKYAAGDVADGEWYNTFCSGVSASVAIDSRAGIKPVLETLVIPWDASWVGGDTNATVVIADNGVEVKRATGVGELVLTDTGRHELTYTTYIGNAAQKEVYTATIFKDWKFEISGGGAVVTATTQTSGAVAIPSEINGYNVTGIGAAAFAGCSNLTEVVIPESVWDIGNGAFANCAGLRRVEVPRGLKSVIEARNVFAGCPVDMEIVYVGAEIKNVTAKQRYPWNGKVDVTYEISGNVLAGLPSESTQIQLVITAEDRKNGTNYVSDATALFSDYSTSIVAAGSHHVIWDLDAQGIEFLSDDVVFKVVYEVVVSGGNDSLCAGESASVKIDSRKGVEPTLDSIVLPWDASWIGGDTNATVVITDNGVEVRRATGAGEFEHAFQSIGKHDLVYTTYNPLMGGMAYSEVYTATVFKDWKFEVEDGGAVVTGTTLISGAIAIPSEVNGYPVTRIAASAFAGCAELTEVVIPGSVWDIGERAFADCAGLRRVELPKPLRDVVESRNVFAGCPADMEIVYVTAEIRNVTASQRYPWNGKVDIAYEIAGDVKAGLPAEDAHVSIVVTAEDRVNGTNYVASVFALSGDTGISKGAHHVVWDLDAQGLSFNSGDVVFSVSYALSQYCVIDLPVGAAGMRDSTTYMAVPPTGGFNTDEYKTTKLVMRRIEPGAFKMGGSHDVTLTKPYYIGVFEVTQKQYELVTGKKPAQYKGDTRPVEKVNWNEIRGDSPVYNWPTEATVGPTSFMGTLCRWTLLDFDLPTEAQWEYACRAGTTGEYNNGGSTVEDLKSLGRYVGNKSDGKGGCSEHTTVGSYLPNDWDLYDMHGNVWEWCLDWHGASLHGGVDPTGPDSSSSTNRICRGGSWSNEVQCCSSRFRGHSVPTYKANDCGFRVARTLQCVNGERGAKTIAAAGRAGALCSGCSESVAVDSRKGVEPTLDSIVLPWDSSWIGDDADAVVVITDNGQVVWRGVGSGAFEHVFADVGRHELIYKTYIRGTKQNEVYAATVFGGWKYEVVEGGAVIVETSRNDGAVTIPFEIDGYGVTGLADGLFAGCSNLTEVAIPIGVTNIGSRAFADCAELKRVVVPDVLKAQMESRNLFDGCSDDLELSYVLAEVRNVTAKQRYPWNGKVDITYTLTGDVTAGLPAWNVPRLFVTASNRVDGTTYAAAASALSGDTGTAEGAHHVVWNMDAQGLKIKSDEVVFTVTYVEKPKPYCVIDLSGGANASSYPVSYLADVPSGGWTDEYKTTKLVLRLIEPGTFMMGGSYQVTLTKPFYCGVFEVTQKQYELVTGSNPSYYKGDMRPVEWVSWNTIRGNSSTYNWPSSANVDSSTFIGKLQARTGLNFDLPTEAQWEYACRAGTTSAYNNGGDTENDLRELGRCWGNRSDGKGGYTDAHTKVGSYEPNAWGLYDMHGNVLEWCLDWYGSPSSGVTDPVGSSSGSSRVLRGGSWHYLADYCSSSSRDGSGPSNVSDYRGFRLVRTLSSTEGERSPEAVAGAERADTLCAAEAAPVAIDSRVDVEPTLDSIVLPWDAAWIGSDTNATVVMTDNGVEVKRAKGVGEFTYTPTAVGRHELTYATYVGGTLQKETYSTVAYAKWKYEVVDGGAVIVETSQKSGSVSVSSEIDGYPVVGLSGGVFAGCIGLTNVTLPDGLKWIGRGAFDGSTSLGAIALPDSLVDWGVESLPPSMREGLAYDADGLKIFNGWLLDCRDRTLVHLEVPEGVVGIGNGALAEKLNLKVVDLPSTLKYIAGDAFRGCASLDELDLPLGVSNVEPTAFFGCNGLREMTLPTHGGKMSEWFPSVYQQIESVSVQSGETEIRQEMFIGCGSLGRIVVPEGVTNIGVRAFIACGSLMNVELPSTLAAIGDEAFAKCGALEEIVLPDFVETIGVATFAVCGNLAAIALPQRLSALPDRVFEGCSSLESVLVPASVEYLGARILPSSVKSVYFLGDAPTCAQGVYATANSGLTNYVVQGTFGWDGRPNSRDLPESWNGREIATWAECRFDVAYDAAGGKFQGTGEDACVCGQVVGMAYVLPTSEPAKTGYSFAGWWTAATGGTRVTTSTIVLLLKEHTLYAHWNMVNPVVVWFDAAGGTVVPSHWAYAAGAEYSFLPVPVWTGHTFVGWMLGDELVSSNAVVSASEDHALVAQWAVNRYLVAFDACGGEGGVTNEQDYASAIVPPDVSREGYTFIGWSPEVDATVPASNVTYTAQWRINQYEVAFDANGGGLGEAALPRMEATQDYATEIVAPGVSREGYTFVGWSPDVDAIVPASNVMYTAQWRINQYKVAFDANGGGFIETALPRIETTQDYGSEIVVPEVAREGYSFVGWSPEVEATVPASNVTYTAQWQINANRIEIGTASEYETEADGAVTLDLGACVESLSQPKIAVKGLPTGLKFDAKTGAITGKVTKPGVYKVTVSATNATVKKAVTATFDIVVPNLVSEKLPGLEQETDAYGVVTCGVAFDPGLVDCSPEDGWTVKAAGLPAGLKLVQDKNTKAYSITGVPTKPGTFTVTFTASKKGEKNQVATITLVTEALPEWAVGTFSGFVEHSAAPGSGSDFGSVTMTVAANGKVSGKMALVGTNYTFSAASYAMVTDDGYFVVEADAKAGKVVRPLRLLVIPCDAPESSPSLLNARAVGSLDSPLASEILMCRGMWKDKSTAAAAKTEIAKWEGVYTLSMSDGGYLSLTVGKDGNVKAAGKLADGTSVSATTPLLHDGETGFLTCVYSAPSAYNGGSLAMSIGFDEGEGGVRTLGNSRGIARWTSRNPQATGEYGEGFSRDVDFSGAYYDKLQKLNAYYESLRVSLDGAPKLGYVYKETDFNDLGRKVTVSENRVADAIDTLWQDGMTVAVNEKGAIVVAKATKPVQDKTTKEWSYDGTNDGALTLSFTQATGIFKGSYTFWYDYESAHDNTTGKSTMTHTSKKVSFEGIMVQGENSMRGFYLWDASSAYDDPKTGKEKTYKYKESYPVYLARP